MEISLSKSTSLTRNEIIEKYKVSSETIKRLVSIRNGMISRCTNSNHIHFKYYGGKGISICKEWLDSWKNFAIWALENGYTNFLTLDRNDSLRNYKPSNCSWKDRLYQAQNVTKIKSGTSKYKGVNLHSGGKFRAYICVDRKNMHLGLFENELDAAKSYNEFVIKNNLNHSLNKL